MNNNIQKLLNIVGNQNKYQFYILIMILNSGLQVYVIYKYLF